MEKLLAQLRGEIDLSANGKCLLWVNPAQYDPYEGDASVATRRVRVPINHVHFAPHRSPYLVALDLAVPGDAAIFADSVEQALNAWTTGSLDASRGQPVCGWVTTKANAESVANHWGWRCHIHGHAGKCKLLRFHDPGVREWLWPGLREEQQRALLGPAQCLFGIGRDHSLLRHMRVADEAATVAFGLDDRQWQQVGDYAAVHAGWLAWRGAFVLQDVLAALMQTKGFGVTQESERNLFALHAMQLGARFHADARMQVVWERTRLGNYYGSVIEDVFNCAADELHLQWTSPEEKQACLT